MSENNKPLQLVAIVEAKEGSRELVRAACIELIAPTRLEKGCTQYLFHEDNENKNIFVFYEVWESHADWQNHMQSEHLKRHIEVTKDIVLKMQIHELTEYNS